MMAALLLMIGLAAHAQDDEAPAIDEPAVEDWEEWVDQLTPSERELLRQLQRWEDELDPMLIERLEQELSGEAYEDDVTKPFDVQMGFEAGTMTGFRVQLVSERFSLPAFGIRGGVHTWQRSDIALQPTALGYVDVGLGELHLIGSWGATRRDGEWGHMGGGAIGWQPWEPIIQIQAGLLWGPGTRSLDISYAWMW